MLLGEEVVYPLVLVLPVPKAGPDATPVAGVYAGIAPLVPVNGEVLNNEPLGPNLGADEKPRVPRLVEDPPTALPWVNMTPQLARKTVLGMT